MVRRPRWDLSFWGVYMGKLRGSCVADCCLDCWGEQEGVQWARDWALLGQVLVVRSRSTLSLSSASSTLIVCNTFVCKVIMGVRLDDCCCLSWGWLKLSLLRQSTGHGYWKRKSLSYWVATRITGSEGAMLVMDEVNKGRCSSAIGHCCSSLLQAVVMAVSSDQ